MDEEWALEQLRLLVKLTRLVQPSNKNGVVYLGDHASPAAPRAEIVASAQVVEKILDRVLPRWRAEIPLDEKGRWQQHREAAQRAVVEIESRAELAAKLGDNAPSLNAGGLHPWAWEAARSLWQSGHFREAVRAAAVKINAETQNKLDRRDTSETALMQFAYSSDAPTPGKSRLRPNGDDGGKTAISLRRGIAAYAEGCFAAIRNPLSHDEGEMPEQHALEQLAALSVLARWIDSSRVISS